MSRRLLSRPKRSNNRTAFDQHCAVRTPAENQLGIVIQTAKKKVQKETILERLFNIHYALTRHDECSTTLNLKRQKKLEISISFLPYFC